MKKTQCLTRRRGESGFALLLVFAMAATIALLLYMEMPRVAFERQREQEALLISRGEQYKRAIQLYFRKFKTYPTSIDALENTNNLRFLRRRYADPLTGKDEWRLIHIGPGGVFTDSLTNKPKGNQQTQNQNNFITEGASLSGDATTDQPTGPAFRRRPSDGGQPQAGGDPNAQQPVTGLQPDQNQAPADPGNAQNQAAQLGLGQNPAQPTTPGQGLQPGTPGAPQSPVSAFPGIPGGPVNPGAQQPGGLPTDPNANPYGQQPGLNPAQTGANPAADLIRNLLTQPRAMPGSQPTAAGGTQISSGSIAGVASKVERRGIKIYNERDKYNEWEFIYDFSKDRTGAGQLAGMMGQPQQSGQLQPGQQPTNTPGFGGQPGSTGAFGFGSPTQQQQPSMPGMQAGPLPPTSSSPQQ
ncbi:MAG TPA: hypothetical protein VK335_28760 [Bryobacteraceae bacterium]|nr:hypothetical protein [Bryobacteraceae bacterium]